MNFPVFTQLAGNFRFPETGSLETASSSDESHEPEQSGRSLDVTGFKSSLEDARQRDRWPARHTARPPARDRFDPRKLARAAAAQMSLALLFLPACSADRKKSRFP